LIQLNISCHKNYSFNSEITHSATASYRILFNQ